MEILFVIAALLALFFLFLPISNRTKMDELAWRIKRLEEQLSLMKTGQVAETPSDVKSPEETKKQTPLPAVEKKITQPAASKAPPSPSSVKKSPVQKQSKSFELQFGAKLPVWIGGIALILGAFYMVKYSLDQNLLSPLVRVLLGTLFGGALVAGGEYARVHYAKKVPLRVIQSISGAGIATLYIMAYSAHALYDFLPPLMAFTSLAAITALAVLMSVRMGMPIALMGLVGGFITPILVDSSSPNPVLLFTYIYLLYAGLMFVVRMMRWVWIPTLATLGALFWVLLWVVGERAGELDILVIGFFLTALVVTHAMLGRPDTPEEEAKANENLFLPEGLTPHKTAMYLASLGGLLAMVLAVCQKGLTYYDWSMYGLLSLATFGLALFRPKDYAIAPIFAALGTAFLLLFWNTDSLTAYGAIVLVFGVFYTAMGHFCLWKPNFNLYVSASLAALTPLAFYLIAYDNFSSGREPLPYAWGGIALLLAALSAYAARIIQDYWTVKGPAKDNLLGLFAGVASAFIAIGLTIELERDFLPVALAMEVAALAWLGARLNIPHMRKIIGAVGVGFLIVIGRQLLLLFQISFFGLFGVELYAHTPPPLVAWPLFQMGVPALLFAIAGFYLYQRKDDTYVKMAETVFVVLLSLTGYYVIRHLFHVNENVLFHEAAFIERGVITNALMVFAVALFIFGQKFNREMFLLFGKSLVLAGLFRIVWFDIFTDNPLFTGDPVGQYFLFNGLTLTFGLPIVSTLFFAKKTQDDTKSPLSAIFYISALALAFLLLSYWVNHAFNGAVLDRHPTDGELYTYSLAWLGLGIALILGGIWRKSVYLRYGSIAVLALTVGKAFFVDASQLEGLYRVFSFIGLGIVLIGLSFVYSRYVFNDEANE